MPGGPPEAFPANYEILHHGALRRTASERPGEKPFYVRFHHCGRFIPFLTPDVHLREQGASCLVRVYATEEKSALQTLEYHYGWSIDRTKPVEFEQREPTLILSHHLHRIVVWPETKEVSIDDLSVPQAEEAAARLTPESANNDGPVVRAFSSLSMASSKYRKSLPAAERIAMDRLDTLNLTAIESAGPINPRVRAQVGGAWTPWRPTYVDVLVDVESALSKVPVNDNGLA